MFAYYIHTFLLIYFNCSTA